MGLLDTRSWYNIESMRKNVQAYAKLILILAFTNALTFGLQKAWFVMSINIFFFLTAIPTLLSERKFRKEETLL